MRRAQPPARAAARPAAPHRAAVSWGSNALREHVTLPASVEPVLERTIYPATTHEAAFSAIERAPGGARPTVLYLGRMTTAKGIEVAYRALAALRREHGIDARLVQVGAAKPEMARRAARASPAELGIDGRDRRPRPARARTSSRACSPRPARSCCPTVEWDVFPLVLIEAGLARVPIVAARIGGVPEAVADGEHALLFEPGDVAACAAALAAVFRDPEAAAERAPSGRTSGCASSPSRATASESERFLAEAAEALS